MCVELLKQSKEEHQRPALCVVGDQRVAVANSFASVLKHEYMPVAVAGAPRSCRFALSTGDGIDINVLVAGACEDPEAVIGDKDVESVVVTVSAEQLLQPDASPPEIVQRVLTACKRCGRGGGEQPLPVHLAVTNAECAEAPVLYANAATWGFSRPVTVLLAHLDDGLMDFGDAHDQWCTAVRRLLLQSIRAAHAFAACTYPAKAAEELTALENRTRTLASERDLFRAKCVELRGTMDEAQARLETEEAARERQATAPHHDDPSAESGCTDLDAAMRGAAKPAM